jgi:NifU-like protein involved in Fe-S cluster formation/bacterioferritin-associated ferredoxin
VTDEDTNNNQEGHHKNSEEKNINSETEEASSTEGTGEVVSHSGQEWFYTDEVKEHFFEPKNILTSQDEAANYKADGVGVVGSPACGDVMKMWIKVDKDKDVISECKWQTFGCASAIASTSMLSVMVTEKDGMKLDEALKITHKDIIKRLGDLPTRKIHCSVLGDKALRSAINDYFIKSGQNERVMDEGIKVIDKILKITNKDIEDAVIEGARTLEQVQEMTKVGMQDKNCIPEVEKLINYYIKKHFDEEAECATNNACSS